MSEQTCGGCCHCKQQQPDPLNLSAPPTYECRAVPPQLTLLPGPRGVGVSINYPPLTPDFPACGLYKAKKGLITEGT